MFDVYGKHLEDQIGSDIITIVGKLINVLLSEFTSLRDYLDELHDDQKNDIQKQLKNIEKKLDDILLGPDYPEGSEMMENAKEDFVKNV